MASSVRSEVAVSAAFVAFQFYVQFLSTSVLAVVGATCGASSSGWCEAYLGLKLVL